MPYTDQDDDRALTRLMDDLSQATRITKIILCTNNETLMQGEEDLEHRFIESCGEAVSDLGASLLQDAGFDFECDSDFRNWHGYRGAAKVFGNLKVYGEPTEQECEKIWSITTAMDDAAQKFADAERAVADED
jgi:hypothetical protein